MNITTNPRGSRRFYSDLKKKILRYNEETPYTVLIDAELSVVSTAIKRCLVQLHCDVFVG